MNYGSGHLFKKNYSEIDTFTCLFVLKKESLNTVHDYLAKVIKYLTPSKWHKQHPPPKFNAL